MVALGLLGRLHPAVSFGIGWLSISLVAHLGHIYGGDQRFQLDWGNAIATGFVLSCVAMVAWWIGYGRK